MLSGLTRTIKQIMWCCYMRLSCNLLLIESSANLPLAEGNKRLGPTDTLQTHIFRLHHFLYIIILLNTYQVRLAIFVMVFVGYKCTKGNVLISNRALRLTTGNGPQRVFWTLFERGNVFKIKKLVDRRNRKYHQPFSSRSAANLNLKKQPQYYTAIQRFQMHLETEWILKKTMYICLLYSVCWCVLVQFYPFYFKMQRVVVAWHMFWF